MRFQPNLSAKEKALQINLDTSIYGSFAEIGAGQETAANFFKAGGASGTIAKTMSAYDMSFSDAIYGSEKSGRYVCEPRLLKMLKKEYGLLEKRLPHKAESTRFFAFANTVEALNFKRTNQGRGWLGVQFQLNPKKRSNLCVIHVSLKDNDSILQQEALGIIGVNLIHSCFYLNDQPEELLNSLIDGLSNHRIEVDYFKLSGPDFDHVDNRLFSLKLVKNGLTKATMFGPDGSVLQPSEVLYKKNILVMRGRFRPVTLVNLDMLECGFSYFKNEIGSNEDIIEIAELTLSNLYLKDEEGKINEKDFLDRVDILCSLGKTVLITNYKEFYKLTEYLSKISRKGKIKVLLGVYNLLSIFDESYYQDLRGGVLEAMGTLFSNNVDFYVYPSLKKDSDELLMCDNLEIPAKMEYLYKHLIENNKIEQLFGCKTENLNIISDTVIDMIKKGKEGWEKMVPEKVAKSVKEKCLFDYPCPVQ